MKYYTKKKSIIMNQLLKQLRNIPTNERKQILVCVNRIGNSREIADMYPFNVT